jgi:hypothetical protein
MPTTTLNLRGIEVLSKKIPPGGNKLGQMLAFSDEIVAINNVLVAPGSSQHTGFCFRVRKPEIWLCQAGYILPTIPSTPFINGGQIEARGLLDFSSTTNAIVAITGGTGDYRNASGEIELQIIGSNPTVTQFTVTVITP